MKSLLFCANWKLNLGPAQARAFCQSFRERYVPKQNRQTWFFPSAVSLEATALALNDLSQARVGAQDIYWEAKGAFTGANSALLAREAGAQAVLIGHSERRQVFGEQDADTARKLRAALDQELAPVLCVGETLEQRERKETEAVVLRQLRVAIEGFAAAELLHLVVAYEPVWAIGTGRNATPADAAAVHRRIRATLREHGVESPCVLYGGSVNRTNVGELLAEPELDGVLVGGASLDPSGWAEICSTKA